VEDRSSEQASKLGAHSVYLKKEIVDPVREAVNAQGIVEMSYMGAAAACPPTPPPPAGGAPLVEAQINEMLALDGLLAGGSMLVVFG
jgi:hypothetical protein